MADDDTETAEAAPSGDLDDRVGKLETGQHSIAEKVDQILGILGKDKGKAHDAAEQHTEEKLDRPSNVADEIRQQLEERDRADAARRKDEEAQGTLASLKAQVAALTEQPPVPAPRRIEKIMWGDR